MSGSSIFGTLIICGRGTKWQIRLAENGSEADHWEQGYSSSSLRTTNSGLGGRGGKR